MRGWLRVQAVGSTLLLVLGKIGQELADEIPQVAHKFSNQTPPLVLSLSGFRARLVATRDKRLRRGLLSQTDIWNKLFV